MSPSSWTVFLSGTRHDLASHYDAAARAIRRVLPEFDVVMMEESVAQDVTTRWWSRGNAAEQDLFVGLIGRYGGSPTAEGVSLTEQEFDAAGHAGVPRLMFLTQEGAPGLADAQDAAALAALARFRQKIQEQVVWRTVSSPEHFAEEVLAALRGWQRETLGGTLVGVRDYLRSFDTMTHGSPVARTTPYTGSRAGIDRLEAFASEENARVLVVHAGWGFGKTRLVLEWARTTRHPVRFLRPGVSFTEVAARSASHERFVLVVDDLHRRLPEERNALMTFLLTQGQSVRLLAITRTTHLEQTERFIRDYPRLWDAESCFELKPLTTDEQESLVAHVMERSNELSWAIARRTGGHPLAGILAAERARQGALSLREIEGPKFRDEIVQRYVDTLTTISGPEGERSRLGEILRLVALCGPIRPADDEQADLLSGFLKISRPVFLDDLEALEKARLLGRSGGLLRVTIDAVAEHLVARASVTHQGVSKCHAEQVLKTLTPLAPNILRNLAVADFDPGRPGRISKVTGAIWELLPELYANAPAGLQETLARGIGSIADAHPERALDFVLRHIDTPLNAQDSDASGRPRLTERVRKLLVEAAGRTTVSPRCVAEACTLLWRIASNPEEPSEAAQLTADLLLKEAGRYETYKPVEMYAALVEWAHQQWSKPERSGLRLTAVLKPLLSREVDRVWSTGKKLTIQPMPLKYSVLADLRARAVDLLEKIGRQGSPRECREVMSVLQGGLLPTRREQGPEWRTEDLYILQALERILVDRNHPVIALGIAYRVRSLSRPGQEGTPDDIQELARRIVFLADSLLDDSLEQVFAESAVRGSDWRQNRQRREAQEERLAEQLVALPAVDALTRVSRAVEGLLDAGAQASHVGRFFFTAARKQPEAAMAWCDHLLANPVHPLRAHVARIANGLLSANPASAARLLARLLEDGSPEVLSNLAISDHHVTALGSTTVMEALARMLAHPSPGVQAEVLAALDYTHSLDVRESARLFMTYVPESSPANYDVWCSTACHHLYGALAFADKELLAQRLMRAEEFKRSAIELLGKLSVDVPHAVVDAMLARIRQADIRSAGLDECLSQDMEDPFAGLPSTERQRAMLAVSELFEHPSSTCSWYAQSWFDCLSANHPEDASSVRRAWIQAGTLPALRRALRSFQRSEPDTLFEAESDVAALLETARKVDPGGALRTHETLRLMRFNGTRQGTPGEPFPRDLDLRDCAKAAAARHPPGSVANQFFATLASDVEADIAAHLRLDAEQEF